MLPLSYYSVSMFLGGLTSLLSAVLIYTYNRQKENIVWLILNLSAALWSFSYFFMINSKSQGQAYLFGWLLHVGGIFIPLLLNLFVLVTTNTYKKYRTIFFIASILAIFFISIAPTSYLVKSVEPADVFNYMTKAGSLFIFYTAYFFILSIITEVILYLEIIKTKDRLIRLRLTYIFWATVIGYIGGGPAFFLTFDIPIPPYLIILFVFYPLIITYAILKHNLFNIKVISTEILLGILWVIIILKIFIANTDQDRITSALLLVVTIVVSIFSIRKTKQEILHREKIEHLAKELEAANSKLKELDELKSEFISLATHHISSPLTAIKGYVSLLQETESPEEYARSKSVLGTVQKLTNNTVNLVKDFIEVHRIDEGKIKLELTNFYIKELIDQLIVEFEPQIKRKEIDFRYENNITKESQIHADRSRLKEAISNIIENSIKYTEHGNIEINTFVRNDTCFIKITDNGIRNLPTISPRLLRKLTQSGNVGEANIIGNGIGIYAAKLLIEANNGRLWIESTSGTTYFNVEFPIAV